VTENKKVAALTLGCKVNLYDTEAMLELFKKKGYELVEFSEKADVYIVNTCTVTNFGDKKSRQMIRRAKKHNPEAILVACGCYAQVAPEEVSKIEEVNLIIGTKDRANIVNIVENYSASKGTESCVSDIMLEREFEELTVESLSDRQRAYLKIQEGCDRFCTYCIIPFARGPVRSRSIQSIAEEAQRLSENGYKEIVLAGIHVASYGKDLGDINLVSVLKKIHEIDGIKRIRFSSVEPTVITNDFINALKAMPKVCEHFHLSLQSGCDNTLKRMNRRYMAAEYENAVNLLRENFPDVGITTDIIVGFPGETDEDFKESMAFAKRMKLSKIHVFPYSPKVGTKAALFKNQIPEKIKHERAALMGETGEKLQIDFLKGFIGRELEVLYEEEKDGVFSGHASNYINVRTESRKNIINEIFKVKIKDIDSFSLISEEI